jgi:nitrite reductase/ring-hydroxylating ferredoxin subunit
MPSIDPQKLILSHRPGGPLASAFYTSPDIFAADMERIWRRQWLSVAHGCMIPKPGDWLTWRIGAESVIVARGEDGKVRAFHNTCRHRGSLICREERGAGPRFVCPYHRWTYGLDGHLMTRTEREFGADPKDLGLHPVALQDTAGLLWINLAKDPPDFSAPAQDIGSRLEHHGMDEAKVAKQVTYRVRRTGSSSSRTIASAITARRTIPNTSSAPMTWPGPIRARTTKCAARPGKRTRASPRWASTRATSSRT